MARTDAKSLFYSDRFSHEEGLISVLIVANPFSYQSLIDGMDRLALLVVSEVNPELNIEHWLWEGARIQVRRVTPEALERLLGSSVNRNVIHWLIQGEIIFDQQGYLTNLRNRALEWSPLIREQKLLSEFSSFVRTYLQAKQDLKEGQILDSYSKILIALHSWANIALVEQGMLPELTVWEQMYRVNLGIYKLFEELTTSSETLEQRVQLVLLACEFTVLNKMQSSCGLLIRIIRSRGQSWTPSALQQHPDLTGVSLDLTLLLNKLVKRGYIREIAKPVKWPGAGYMELSYTSVVH